MTEYDTVFFLISMNFSHAPNAIYMEAGEDGEGIVNTFLVKTGLQWDLEQSGYFLYKNLDIECNKL